MKYKCYECGEHKTKDCYGKAELDRYPNSLPSCYDCKYIISRKGHLEAKYGITQEQYEDLLIDQLGVCAICKKREKSKDKRGNTKLLFIDHCHTTGKIRGLLCHNCNTALGHFKDSEESLVSAIEYLRKSRE